MTISNTARLVLATGNGATTEWPFSFIVPSADDLQVSLIESGVTTLVDPINYSVTGLNNPAGGTVTYPLVGSPITSAVQILIERVVDFTQETSFANQQRYYPEVLEQALDRIVMQTQQNNEELSRSVLYPPDITPKSGPELEAYIADLEASAAASEAAAAGSAFMADASAALADARADDAASFAGFRDYQDVATLLANTSLAYGAGSTQVAAGDIIRTRAEGFSYEVAASGATDQDVTTAGGVKLIALLGESGQLHADQFNAPFDGVTDATSALTKAWARASALKTQVVLNTGTYLCRSSLSRTKAGGTCWTVFDLVSDFGIVATLPGLSVIKLAAGESTEAAPRDIRIFHKDGYIENVSFWGVDFDLNGDENPITPEADRLNGNWSRFSFAAFSISGNTAWCKNVHFKECTFRNTPGSSQIIAGQSENGVAGPLSQNVTIDTCYFYDNGTDTADHSCVFMWAENAWCRRSQFIQRADLSKTDRNWASYEIHGKNAYFQENLVKNFFRGCWISSNFTAAAENIWVTDNVFECWGVGPSLFRTLTSLTEVNNVHIARNNILITADTTALSVKSGVEAASCYYRVKNIRIYDNIMKSLMAGIGASAGVLLGSSYVVDTMGDIVILNNEGEGFQYGLFARTYKGTGNFSDIIEMGNRWKDLKIGASGISVGSYYIAFAGKPMGRVKSLRNDYQSSAGAKGFRQENDFDYLEVDANTFDGMTAVPPGTALSVELASPLLITRRVGRQINLVSNNGLPTSSTYLAGETVEVYNPTNARNISHWKYDGTGWRCFGHGWGTTANRPTLTANDDGYRYWDETLLKEIAWNGTAWLE